MADPEYDYLFKLVLIGDSAVGKSSLLLRYADNAFPDPYMCTLGIDFRLLIRDVEGKRAKLQVWDTAGQERFRTISRNYYRGSHGVILVYDVTDKESFDNVKHWVQEIEAHAQDGVSRLLVGNKSDLSSRRAVPYEEGREFAEKLGVRFMETSAKSAQNVEDCFQAMAREVKQRLDELPKPRRSSRRVGLGRPSEGQPGCCGR